MIGRDVGWGVGRDRRGVEGEAHDLHSGFCASMQFWENATENIKAQIL